MRIDADTRSCYLSAVDAGDGDLLHQYVDYVDYFNSEYSFACVSPVCCAFRCQLQHKHTFNTVYVNVCSTELNWMVAAMHRLLWGCVEIVRISMHWIFCTFSFLQLPQLPVMPLPPHCWFVFIWTSQSNGSFCEMLSFVCRLRVGCHRRAAHCSSRKVQSTTRNAIGFFSLVVHIVPAFIQWMYSHVRRIYCIDMECVAAYIHSMTA